MAPRKLQNRQGKGGKQYSHNRHFITYFFFQQFNALQLPWCQLAGVAPPVPQYAPYVLIQDIQVLSDSLGDLLPSVALLTGGEG